MAELSFRTRLMLVTLASSFFALALSCMLLAIWQYLDASHDLELRNRQIASVLAGAAGAPVVFGDTAATRDTVAVAARLANVRALAILDRAGRPLADYRNSRHAPGDDAAIPPSPARRGSAQVVWRGSAMRITMPIAVTGEVVGWVDMTVAGGSFATLAKRTAWVALGLLAIAGLAAAALNRWLQPMLLRPMERLLVTMEDITRSADYSLRVPHSRDREIERVLSAFNSMVAEVERREAELANTLTELEQARDAAETANVAKSQFLAGMSHELRTPLNAVIAYAELLMEDMEAEGASQHVEDLRVINQSAKHLLTLINEVLDFAKIEARQISLDLHAFDPHALLNEVAATLKPLAARNNNRIDLRVDTILPAVVLDSTKLRQCLLNLGANACKFTEHGQITIAAMYVSDRDMIVVAIHDTGIGIARNVIERLFVPFTQADTSTTRRYGGTGLGLAITDEFVRLMGGTINVHSVEGLGSTFTITLPRRLPAGGTAQPLLMRTAYP